MRASDSSSLSIRGLRYHVRSWGAHDAPLVVLLHGWMDASASFQFLVDELGDAWRFIAPDWRGFGLSEWAGSGVYAYADYVADLDALMSTLDVNEPVHIVGHSLGGNIASLYAASRPERVRSLVNIEGFGLRARAATDAPTHLRQWLDDLNRVHERRPYPSIDAIVARVRELSARITPERALFVANHWSEKLASGEYRLHADPAHRRTSPDLFRLDELQACWASVQAPVLWVEADQSENIARHALTLEALAARRASIRNITHARIIDSGHMVHWDQPEQLARTIRDFLRSR